MRLSWGLMHSKTGITHDTSNVETEGAWHEQSLEFVAETRILVEMKIENHGKNIFRAKKNRQAYFFSMKIKGMDLWMQIEFEGTKLIFIMNFGVLDFFKFALRMPQIAQILVLTFKIFRSMLPDPTRNFLFFLQ